MECPHCKYKHGWCSEEARTIDGADGEFYRLSNNIEMERQSYDGKATRDLFGCPSCDKIFMN